MLTSSKYVSVNATGVRSATNRLLEPETTSRFGAHLMAVISVQSFAQMTPRKHNSRTSTAPLHALSLAASFLTSPLRMGDKSSFDSLPYIQNDFFLA
jgi:hypothetical protein